MEKSLAAQQKRCLAGTTHPATISTTYECAHPPPLVAQAVLRIYEETHDAAFLHTILPKLKKYFEWLARERDFEGNSLISIITPFESGMDWKPSFDPVVCFPHGPADLRLYLRVHFVDFRNFLHRYHLRAIYKANYFIVKEVGLNTIYV